MNVYMEQSTTTPTDSILSTASLQLLLAKLSAASSSTDVSSSSSTVPTTTLTDLPIKNVPTQPALQPTLSAKTPTCYTSKMPYYDVDGQAVIANVSIHEIQSRTKTCRWDMQAYSTRTWLLPIAFDTNLDDYIGEGNFCSLSCVKAYVLTHYDFVVQQEFIARIDDYATRHCVPLPILPAPPREFLPCFGTKYKTIDAFRAQATPQMQHCVDRFEFSQIHERAYPHMGQQCNLLETCEEIATAAAIANATASLISDTAMECIPQQSQNDTSFVRTTQTSSMTQKKSSVPRKRRKKNDIE